MTYLEQACTNFRVDIILWLAISSKRMFQFNDYHISFSPHNSLSSLQAEIKLTHLYVIIFHIVFFFFSFKGALNYYYFFRTFGHQCPCMCDRQAHQSGWYPWTSLSDWPRSLPRPAELRNGSELYGYGRVHPWLGRKNLYCSGRNFNT